MAIASGIAAEIVGLARRMDEYKHTAEPVDELTGPRAAILRQSFRGLFSALQVFEPLYVKFIAEHRALFDDPDVVRSKIETFLGWAKDRAARLESHVDAYAKAYGQALRENRDAIRAEAAEWAETDDDGWA